VARVSVVIPTWNGADLLAHALRSLAGQSFRDFDVVVVDNASTDGTLTMLAHDHPRVHVVRMNENVGFAAAVNAGIRATNTEIVALLNNDTEAHPDWLASLVRTLDDDAEVGSCASKMLDFHDRTRIDSAGDRLGIFASQRGHGEADGPDFAEPVDVLSASAGAAAYRRSLFDEVGPFDERYFAYFEDVDLGVRARLAGWRCRYVPDAVVYHVGSASSRRMSERAFYLRSRNAMILGFQYLPARRLLLFGPLLALWPFVRAAADGQRLSTAWRALAAAWRQRHAIGARRRATLGRARKRPRAYRAYRKILARPLSRNGAMRRGLPRQRHTEADRTRPVDVVIVNWNGFDDLPRCIEALGRSTVPVRVVVVDNASGDGSVAYLRGAHDWVDVVALDENRGYAGGANEGLRRATGDFALIMNPDAILAPDHVERLRERLLQDPSIGIAQGRLYRITREDGGADETAFGQVLDSAGHVIPRTRRVKDRGQGQMDEEAFDVPASVFSASGAAIFLRRSMWEDVAPDGEVFDEAFFAYKEEIDLCWRARWLGWDVVYVPDAVAGHVRAWSGRGLPPIDRVPVAARRHSWKNHYLLLAKNDRLSHLVLHLPWVLGWELARQGYALLHDRAVYGSYGMLLRALPSALRRRRDVFRRRRTPPAEMRAWFGGTVRPVCPVPRQAVEA